MAGSQTLRLRGGRFAAALAVSFLTSAGGARAQNPSPPLPPAGMPAASFAEVVDAVTAPAVMPVPMTGPGPTYHPASGAAPTAPRVELGLFDTITESIFGKPDPNTWRPLSLATLFSEGWNEAWVPSPNGSGGAPRQGWINAADGNLYRLWFFTFAQAFNSGPKGNAYLGAYTIFAPLSRRRKASPPQPRRSMARPPSPISRRPVSGSSITGKNICCSSRPAARRPRSPTASRWN